MFIFWVYLGNYKSKKMKLIIFVKLLIKLKMINKSKKKFYYRWSWIHRLFTCNKASFLGHYVTVVDKFLFKKNSLDHLMIYENFNLVKGDIRNKKMVKNIVKDKDIVIPLAALVGAPLCEKNKTCY